MFTVIKWVWNIVSGVFHSQSFSLLSIHDMLLQHSFRHIQCRAQSDVCVTRARKAHFHVALPKALGMHLAGRLSGPHTVGKSPEINARAVIPCNRHFDGAACSRKLQPSSPVDDAVCCFLSWIHTYTARKQEARILRWFFFITSTPRKINVEPENASLEKENHLPNHHFHALC